MEVPILPFEDLLSILILIGSGYLTLVLAQYWMGPGKGGAIQNLPNLDKFFICLIIGNIQTIASLTVLCYFCSTPFPSGVDEMIQIIRQNMLNIHVFNIPWIIIIAFTIAAVLRSESLDLPWLPFDKRAVDKWLLMASLIILFAGYGLFLWSIQRSNGTKIASLYMIFIGSMFFLKSLKRSKISTRMALSK